MSHFRDQGEEWKALHNMLTAQLVENVDDRGREPVDGGVDIFEILETFPEAVEAVSVKPRPSKAKSAQIKTQAQTALITMVKRVRAEFPALRAAGTDKKADKEVEDKEDLLQKVRTRLFNSLPGRHPGVSKKDGGLCIRSASLKEMVGCSLPLAQL